ncbi:MAG: hypothetical protein E6Q85_04230 [Thiothrix sp.]|nr:MAG: hypothetical protein E6Q85_04230 [Thiothrix sp.]
MKNKKKLYIWILIGLANTTSAYAHTARLDDSASARSTVEARTVTSETGMPLAESPSAEFVYSNFGWVQYRLTTSAYKGKSAKIYYVIPNSIEGLQRPHALLVSWKTNGQFMDGEGHAGDRILVWSGTVTDDWMQTDFDLKMQLELDQVRLAEGKSFEFESYFEIEINE